MSKSIPTALSIAAVLATGLAAPLPALAQGKPLGGLFSCDAGGGKQEGGALIGAGVGALLGTQVAKNEKGLGALVGAAAGAAAGSYIGCRMQSTDTARAQAATKKALETGQSQAWSNPRTGASGRVDVVASTYGPPIAGDQLRFERNIRQLASYDAVGADYTVRSTANLRAGPSTSESVVGKLTAGERVEVLGGVPGSNWLLVGRGGYGTGYVSSSLLTAGGYGPEPSCRTIAASISTRGQRPTTERYNACKDGRGEWQLTQV
ncbi:SH3 domain-containing protein [Caulobacter endophyticus]|uniref:SH3 domain-containing protein n=1 Tax=Caulobacter endophyticus TaxID=2172652 RepID=UPI00240F2298|nr:SH3 domain-containing protein [Caulobacter endophyticus]MDG2531160.1 SH3 domain-containing protein [Caulobacter endophyticus]